MIFRKICPAIGCVVEGFDWARPAVPSAVSEVYDALLEHQTLVFPKAAPTAEQHLAFASCFGALDEPHPVYPNVDGYRHIVLLESTAETPPDTNSWHTDLTFKATQPFASVLVARTVPECGGDTLWASLYSAYDRLSDGLKADLENLEAVHDLGDFRNTVGLDEANRGGAQRLNEAVGRFGHQIRPLVAEHPVTKRRFLNFNEAFVTHIMGLTTNESNALRTLLANHMSRPEIQMRWRWSAGDVVMWDNRVTMHYAVSDYLPNYRVMNRITLLDDRLGSARG
ncbi:MAG: TauD/TfdA family dioxygenase [Pseudomonadota bacterium]